MKETNGASKEAFITIIPTSPDVNVYVEPVTILYWLYTLSTDVPTSKYTSEFTTEFMVI